jgi:hypothetical protein
VLHALGTRVVIGLTIAAALGLADLVGAFAPPPEIGEAPPAVATIAAAVAGVVTLVGAGVMAWAATRERARTPERVALGLVVASRVVSVLVAVPVAFLTGLTVPLVIWSVVVVVITVVAIALIITGAFQEEPAPPTAR